MDTKTLVENLYAEVAKIHKSRMDLSNGLFIVKCGCKFFLYESIEDLHIDNTLMIQNSLYFASAGHTFNRCTDGRYLAYSNRRKDLVEYAKTL